MAHTALPPRCAPVARQWLGGTVKVFEHDPELLDGLDPADAEAARAAGVAPLLNLGTGAWTPPRGALSNRVLGLLVLDGLLVRSVEMDGTLCPELLGRGDLLRPWDDGPEQLDLGLPASWKVIEPATLAVLDGRFVDTLRRWPWISQALVARCVQRSRSIAVRTAIPQIRRADDRLRMLFRELSARWGRVTPHGVLVPLPLTNQLIAQLVCLRRPTTSSTMTRLARDGEIVRRPGSGFLVDLAPSLQGRPGAGGCPRRRRTSAADAGTPALMATRRQR